MNTLQSENGANDGEISSSLGYDFALLGLRAREARVEVIRRAACETAQRVHNAAQGEQEHDAMLSDLAASTYRLLDPRRRRKMLERVQLCIFSEADQELQKDSHVALIPERRNSVVAELVE